MFSRNKHSIGNDKKHMFVASYYRKNTILERIMFDKRELIRVKPTQKEK